MQRKIEEKPTSGATKNSLGSLNTIGTFVDETINDCIEKLIVDYNKVIHFLKSAHTPVNQDRALLLQYGATTMTLMKMTAIQNPQWLNEHAKFIFNDISFLSDNFAEVQSIPSFKTLPDDCKAIMNGPSLVSKMMSSIGNYISLTGFYSLDRYLSEFIAKHKLNAYMAYSQEYLSKTDELFECLTSLQSTNEDLRICEKILVEGNNLFDSKSEAIRIGEERVKRNREEFLQEINTLLSQTPRVISDDTVALLKSFQQISQKYECLRQETSILCTPRETKDSSLTALSLFKPAETKIVLASKDTPTTNIDKSKQFGMK